jgi:putative iron-only hydrogenase system regulator
MVDLKIGAVVLVVTEEVDIGRVNEIISEHSDLILGRQGIPLREHGASVISLVLRGDTDYIGSLSGKLGRLHGVKVKSLVIG